ncbi:MAG: aminotransferase class IV [Aquificaceae bacterium]|nr:aminotransferase class IV [Aquificaceae bacterium]MDW8293752.1 aminotransferase class IV [Aquificaceae bacterium]
MMVNRTLLFGEGLFETIRWKPSEEKLSLHYQRLSSSAKTLGIPCPTYEEFRAELEKHTHGGDGLYVKYLLISKGGDHLTHSPQAYGELILVKALKSQPYRVDLCLSSYRRHSSDPLCGHKTTSYLFNLLVKREALSRGFHDGIVLNEKDQVCETATSNLLLLRGSRFYTPAKSSGLLWGTTLEFLRRRLEIEEEYIRFTELDKYDALFVLNSLMLCAMVERLEERTLNIDIQGFKELRGILRASLYSQPEGGPPDR